MMSWLRIFIASNNIVCFLAFFIFSLVILIWEAWIEIYLLHPFAKLVCQFNKWINTSSSSQVKSLPKWDKTLEWFCSECVKSLWQHDPGVWSITYATWHPLFFSSHSLIELMMVLLLKIWVVLSYTCQIFLYYWNPSFYSWVDKLQNIKDQ